MGAGRLVSELTVRGWTTSGIDASSEMVEAARTRLPAAAERLSVGAIERLPYEDSSFDLVVATGVLEYADVDRALGQLTRVLRPTGLAVVSYPNPEALYGIWKSRAWYPGVRLLKRLAGRAPVALPQGSLIVPPRAFRARLESAGLEPTATRYAGFLVLPTPVELLVPGLAERLGRVAEDRERGARRLGTQVVFAARRPDR
jgi:SAM-dependent methyltransferase